jgi:regulator of protease activity HflC (stomatin/prohibitin superfamily)
MDSARGKAVLTAVALILVISAIGGVLSYEQVPEGHQGVTTEWGAVTGETLDSGAHWKIPIMQNVQPVEIRPRTYTMSQTEGEGQRSQADAIAVKTVNGTTVQVDVTVRYRINASQADTFVEDWNNEDQMESRLIRPTIRSDLRDEASDIQTSDIYTREGREALTETAQESLNEEFSDEPIVLEEVQVRNIDLPDSIDQTLDEKEQAKQQVEVERERIEQEEARAEQRRVEAQGEADVIDIRGNALENNTVVLQARMIEAYDEGTMFVTDGGQEIIVQAPEGANNSTAGPQPGDG